MGFFCLPDNSTCGGPVISPIGLRFLFTYILSLSKVRNYLYTFSFAHNYYYFRVPFKFTNFRFSISCGSISSTFPFENWTVCSLQGSPNSPVTAVYVTLLRTLRIFNMFSQRNNFLTVFSVNLQYSLFLRRTLSFVEVWQTPWLLTPYLSKSVA